MKKITQSMTSALSHEAAESDRKRKNLNFHADYSDPINRMLNAFEPETYVQPHKHENPDKVEIFVILSGKAVVVEFNDAGDIVDHCVLDYGAGMYGIEIPARVWHTLISLETGTVLYEIKQGPYEQIVDKNFAAWAPKEGETGMAEYNRKLLDALGCVLM